MNNRFDKPFVSTNSKIPDRIQKEINAIIFQFSMIELLVFLRDYAYEQSKEWRNEGDTDKANAWLKLAMRFDID